MKTGRKCHILEEHYLDFYNRAVSILNDEDDAKDAVQEAVVKTLVKVGVHDAVAYCYRITENECVNIIRHRCRTMQLDEEVVNRAGDDHRLQQELKEAREVLLPMEQRVFRLHHDEGYTITETAARAGVSPATVKRLLATAKEKIKYMMEI